MTTQLDSLKTHSLVVADTGDLNAIRRYQPQDATTNPSLILKAFELPDYQPLIEAELAAIRAQGGDRQAQAKQAVDRLAVAMGIEIAQVVPGRVSTEVAARLSFDEEASVRKAHELIEYYDKRGVGRDRVLIKLASTWEGIRAAERLEREGIQCNLTLLFSDAQAFVDNTDTEFVRGVCQRVNQGGYDTVVMGASFRTTGQVLALAGCPRLTISPALLEELAGTQGDVTRAIAEEGSQRARPEALGEPEFRWEHNQNAMANDKLAEGIRRFAEDQAHLAGLIAESFK